MAGTDQVLITVPHVLQKFRWDCGLACSQMVLRYLGKNIDDFETACKSLEISQSVWTIDLARIMSYYGVRHHFCTLTLGVDSTYASKRFYKARFDVDEQRVNELFHRAHELNLSIEKKLVSFDDIKAHLSQHGVAIVLIDCNLLYCLRCENIQSAVGCAGGCFGNCVGRMNSYEGHFVVVCGYNTTERVVYYKNPASKKDHCVCTQQSFDKARKAHGTDNDILLVFPESSHDLNQDTGDMSMCDQR